MPAAAAAAAAARAARRPSQNGPPLLNKVCARERWLRRTAPHHKAPLYLDCCGLVRKVLRDLVDDFGFEVGKYHQSYQMDCLPIELAKEDMKPGDLVFTQAPLYDLSKKRKEHDTTHVEIWMVRAVSSEPRSPCCLATPHPTPPHNRRRRRRRRRLPPLRRRHARTCRRPYLLAAPCRCARAGRARSYPCGCAVHTVCAGVVFCG